MTPNELSPILNALHDSISDLEARSKGPLFESHPALGRVDALVSALSPEHAIYQRLRLAMLSAGAKLTMSLRDIDELHAPLLMGLEADCKGLAAYLQHNQLTVSSAVARAFNRLAHAQQYAPIHPQQVAEPPAAQPAPAAEPEEAPKSSGRKKKADDGD